MYEPFTNLYGANVGNSNVGTGHVLQEMLALLAYQVELLASVPLKQLKLETNSKMGRGFQAGFIDSLTRHEAILQIPKRL